METLLKPLIRFFSKFAKTSSIKLIFLSFLIRLCKDVLLDRIKHAYLFYCSDLQSVTKIVRLAPPPPLFNVGCKFVYTFLVLAAWHGFFRLGTTLRQGEGGTLGNFNQA